MPDAAPSRARPARLRDRVWRAARELGTSLSARIFLGYFLVLGVVAYAGLSYLSDAIKPAVRQTMEETMVEEVGLLAALLEGELAASASAEVVPPGFETAIRGLRERDLLGRIHGVDKRHWDQRVYVTDARGVVRFDSTGRDLGVDYRRWNNVKLALEGKYGVRSTHSPAPDGPSTMHVSSALRRDGAIVGVVTVAKRVADVDPFLKLARARLLRAGTVAVAVSLGVGILFSWLLSRSVARLSAYAERAAAGDRVAPPTLSGELGALAHAMEHMRTQLEGKGYVEQAMQTFAHEMKSPLSGILASAELLEGDLAPEDRARFAGQVQGEARRMQRLLERLLELAVVEQRQGLREPASIPVARLVKEVQDRLRSRLEARELTVRVRGDADARVWGESILLQQALGNLLDNAIDFADPGGTIRVDVTREAARVTLRVHDTGASIPAYAEARIFERFYSLARPISGARSQGLGLAFVREVTALHGGEIALANATVDGEAGVTATWSLPTRHAG